MPSPEYLDLVGEDGHPLGVKKLRKEVHRHGDWHRAVHIWLLSHSTNELLLQKRADDKDSWPSLWDISSAGHISAGDGGLDTCQKELEEELGLTLPANAFEPLFVYRQACVTNGGTFINNEFDLIYLVTTRGRIPEAAMKLQEEEVAGVKYMAVDVLEQRLREGNPDHVPTEVSAEGYGQLFAAVRAKVADTGGVGDWVAVEGGGFEFLKADPTATPGPLPWGS